MEAPKGKYHAEVKSHTNGTEVRINIFAENLGEVFQDIVVIQKQFAALTAGQVPPIIAGIVKAVEAASGAQAVEEIFNKPPQQVQPAQKPQPPGKQPTDPPVCEYCGNIDGMELIEFLDKKSGKPRKAWKCQTCEKWHFEGKKK